MSDTKFQDKILNAGASFNPTCWTDIAAAGEGNEESLNEFCRQYWHPLYAYARRSGKSVEESQDLTQGFFTSFLAKEKLLEVQQGKGRFRNFLLILFKRYMINEFTKSKAEKRGGKLIKLDFDEAEEWLAGQSLAPDELFHKAWALSTIELAMDEIKKRFIEKDDLERFEIMRPHLDNSAGETYKVSAEKLACSENSFKVAIHRLKKEFGKTLRLKIESTLDKSSDIDDELKFLSEILKK
jgi:DNA-directed RNA polymerase specialized sigma24 family protein